MTTEKDEQFKGSSKTTEVGRSKKFKWTRPVDILFIIAFCASIVLLVCTIKLYRNTFIEWQILVAPIMIGCTAGVLFLWKTLRKFLYPVWATVMIGVAIGSAVPYFTFLYTNYKFADATQITQDFKIEKRGKLAKGRRSCGKPYAVINFYELRKEIIFECSDIERMSSYSQVSITYSLGLFGYKIIRAKALKK